MTLNLKNDPRLRELILYLVCGIGATAINIISFELFSNYLSMHYILANIFAWIVAFIFAFYSNKLWVFNSKSWEYKVVSKEFIGFFSARISTGILDTLLMILFISVLFMSELWSKIIVNIVVIAVNYIASKYIIFKKVQNYEQEQ